METKLKDSEIVAELIESVRHDMEMPKEIWNRGMGLLQKFQQFERDEEAAQDKAAFEEACKRGWETHRTDERGVYHLLSLRQADALSGNVLSGNAEESSAAVSPYEREQRGNRSAGAACVLTQTGRTPAAGIRQNSGTLPEERRSFV